MEIMREEKRSIHSHAYRELRTRKVFGIKPRKHVYLLIGACSSLVIGCLLVVLAIPHLAVARDNLPAPVATACGSTRFVKVRFQDGSPVPLLRLVLTAPATATASASATTDNADSLLGSHETFVASTPEQGNLAHTFPWTPTPDLDEPEPECHPVSTGTLAAVTNADGVARFEGLGDGNWLLRFEGTLAYGTQTASVVPAIMQGLYPYGRTRYGGGFTEMVNPLNEEGAPDSEPVEPGTGATTSRYVLQFSGERSVWLPSLDLATDDNEAPLPLADLSPVPSSMPSEFQYSIYGTPVRPDTPFTTPATAGGPGPVFAEGAQSLRTTQLAQARQGRTSNLTWVALLVWPVVFGLALGGVAAFLQGARSSSESLFSGDIQNRKHVEGTWDATSAGDRKGTKFAKDVQDVEWEGRHQ